MINYINDLFTNHALESSPDFYNYYDENFNMVGGNKENKPYGGMPPIFLYENADETIQALKNTDEKKKYEKAQDKNIIDVKKILKERSNNGNSQFKIEKKEEDKEEDDDYEKFLE